jgi:pyruvate dehydrogenase (quinone)
MARTVADPFAQVLAAAGVTRIYGIAGDSLNGLTDSLRRQGKSEWIMAQSIGAQAAFGFMLYMGKAILSGGGDEVGDLARTNLWR